MLEFSWNLDEKDALTEQTILSKLVVIKEALSKDCNFRNALAIGSSYNENSRSAIAIGYFFNKEGKYSQNRVEVEVEVDFPYIPGLLAFRVGPAICALLDGINFSKENVDLLLLDGQGLAHPRGLGLASHIGVLYDMVCIGLTRNLLFGHNLEPLSGRLNHSEIFHPKTNKIIGAAVSLGEKCSPVYVSPGHKITVNQCVELLENITPNKSCYPPALRKAHSEANQLAKTDFFE